MKENELSSMEKISSKESEHGEIKKARDFFIDSLPLLDVSATEKMAPKELFSVYQNFINNDPSFENFKKIIVLTGGDSSITHGELKTNQKLADLWKKYLINKLPKSLVERQMEIQKVEDEEELDARKLEILHSKRLETGHKMILGFHVTDNRIEGEILPGNIPTTLVGEKNIDIPAGRTYYSTGPQALYKQRHKYLALIEGDQSEVEKEREKIGDAHGRGEWVSTNRKLPVLESFELAALAEPLELKMI